MSDEARRQLGIAFAAGVVLALFFIVSYPAVFELEPVTVFARELAK